MSIFEYNGSAIVAMAGEARMHTPLALHVFQVIDFAPTWVWAACMLFRQGVCRDRLRPSLWSAATDDDDRPAKGAQDP